MSRANVDNGAGGMRGGDPAEPSPGYFPEDVAETVGRLRKKLEEYQRRRARGAGWIRRFIPTGLERLDAVLPHGGLPAGAITELLSDVPGVGAMSLAMRIAAQCCGSIQEGRTRPAARVGRAPPAAGLERFSKSRAEPRAEWNPDISGARAVSQRETTLTVTEKTGTTRPPEPLTTPADAGMGHRTDAVDDHRAMVLVDTFQDFYPPAAGQYGIALERLIVIRTNHPPDAFWAVDQALRCRAVAVVIAPLEQLDERRARRLQLAAESSGSIGLILRPARSRVKSFAAVQMLLEGVRDQELKEMGRPTHPYTGKVLNAPPYQGGKSRPVLAGEGSHDAPCSEGPRIFPRVYAAEPYLCRITLLTVREGMPAGPLMVDLHHETGAVSLPSIPVDRSTAKTG